MISALWWEICYFLKRATEAPVSWSGKGFLKEEILELLIFLRGWRVSHCCELERVFPGSSLVAWKKVKEIVHCSVMSNSLWPPWTIACQALSPWDFPGKNTGMGCHFLLQGIFLTQGLNLGLLHCRQILYRLNHQVTVIRIHGFHCFSLGSIPGHARSCQQCSQKKKKKREREKPCSQSCWKAGGENKHAS